jgi:hypothetical protein
MNAVVDHPRTSRTVIDDAWLRRIGPGQCSHINFRGTFRFPIQKYAESLVRHTYSQAAASRQPAKIDRP